MPGKMARSDPRPGVRVTRGAGSSQHLASVLQEGRENANIDAGLGFIWRISVKELQRRDVEEAARKFGQQVHVGNAASVDDFDRVLSALVRLNASALLVTADAVFLSRRDRLVGLVAHYALPAVYSGREFVARPWTELWPSTGHFANFFACCIFSTSSRQGVPTKAKKRQGARRRY